MLLDVRVSTEEHRPSFLDEKVPERAGAAPVGETKDERDGVGVVVVVVE